MRGASQGLTFCNVVFGLSFRPVGVRIIVSADDDSLIVEAVKQHQLEVGSIYRVRACQGSPTTEWKKQLTFLQKLVRLVPNIDWTR